MSATGRRVLNSRVPDRREERGTIGRVRVQEDSNRASADQREDERPWMAAEAREAACREPTGCRQLEGES